MTSDPTAPERSSFPHWVAAGCLAIGLWLFFGSTVPALQERDELRGAAAELRALQLRCEQAAAQLAAAQTSDSDLQSLLVAIDRLGWTPDELLRHHPAPAEEPQGTTSDQQAADRRFR